MENDVKNAIESSHNEHSQQSSDNNNTIIDTINNNINCLIERLQCESESVKSVIGCDESSLPSPKAMLDAIMPCEKICNNFRHIADDFSAGSVENVLKIQIKAEHEPKVLHDEEHDEFPLNLKAYKNSLQKGQFSTDKMDQRLSNDEFNQSGSPKAKKIFINMLDQMQLSHSPKPKMQQQQQQQKMKSGDGKSMNLSSPSSYNSSSPSSTSSLSSTPNPQHQKHGMSHGQSINGSMHDLLNLSNFSHLQQMPTIQHRSTPISMTGMNPGSPLMTGGVLLGLGLPQSPQLPQLILTSGQLVQGIQGAQVLIPTSQGITSQTILTIPVSQQLPTSLSIDQLLQSLSSLSHKQQSSEQPSQQTSSNHVLSNVPSLSPNPILLNSHLLASGAQQLLSIQPQLMAFQQQQHAESFYRHKSHHDQSERKEHMNQFKMRSREMSKRLSRMSRGINGHQSEMIREVQEETHGEIGTSNRIPTTNGDTSMSQLKSQPSPHLSPIHSKNYQTSSPPQQKLEFRAMRELLSDERRAAEAHLNEMQNNEESSKERRQSGEKENEKNERESPFAASQQQHESTVIQPTSPVNLSNDSHEEDERSYEGRNQNDPSSDQRDQLPEGIDLDEINEFAQAFKLQRLSLGLTQTQVGQALSVTEGPAYSQSAICSALAARMYAAVQLSSQQQQMFEKLDITPKSAQKIKPVLEQWMKEAKGSRFKMGESPLTDFMGVETSKKRKRRTSFTPHALEILNSSFERNTHPSGTDITSLAQALGYEREVIRIWFCNKRQALKNTVRMMSKGMPN